MLHANSGDNTYSGIDKEHVRALLEAKLTELIDTNLVAQTAVATVDLDQSRVGRLSRMDALQNQAISQTALIQRAQEIADTKSALKRVDTGEYGVCIVCDDAVDPRRIVHNPAASMCIQCAELAEK